MPAVRRPEAPGARRARGAGSTILPDGARGGASARTTGLGILYAAGRPSGKRRMRAGRAGRPGRPCRGSYGADDRHGRPYTARVTGGEPECADEIELPRPQAGTPPQHLITTLLGDYWLRRSEPLPSAALVRLAGEFGVSDLAARAALSRLARRDVLAPAKVGRRTYYRLTEGAAAVLEKGRRRIMSFGLPRGEWDGRWTLAGFSVAEEQRNLRHLLRARLRWLGFAPLYDGLWVSPTASPADTAAALAELGVGSATVFRASAVDIPGLRRPEEAWDLQALREDYERFIAHCRPLLARVRRGEVGTAEALIARSGIMDMWRTFPGRDPDLPVELLPAEWPRSAARELFVEIYDSLGTLAEIRVKQIVAEYAPELAALVSHHRTGDDLAPPGEPA